MKARVKTKVSINAAPSEVFRYLTNTDLHLLWNPQLKKVYPHTELTKGDTYTSYSTVLGVRVKSVNEIRKLGADKEIEFANQTGMIEYCANYKLVAEGNGTQLICTLVVSTENKAFAFARPMLEQLARRELRVDLDALKNAVEQKLG